MNTCCQPRSSLQNFSKIIEQARCANSKLSTSMYDLVLIYVCHFHHHPVIFLSNHGLSRYSCLHLGSLHPRIFYYELSDNFFLSNQSFEVPSGSLRYIQVVSGSFSRVFQVPTGPLRSLQIPSGHFMFLERSYLSTRFCILMTIILKFFNHVLLSVKE